MALATAAKTSNTCVRTSVRPANLALAAARPDAGRSRTAARHSRPMRRSSSGACSSCSRSARNAAMASASAACRGRSACDSSRGVGGRCARAVSTSAPRRCATSSAFSRAISISTLIGTEDLRRLRRPVPAIGQARGWWQRDRATITRRCAATTICGKCGSAGRCIGPELERGSEAMRALRAAVCASRARAFAPGANTIARNVAASDQRSASPVAQATARSCSASSNSASAKPSAALRIRRERMRRSRAACMSRQIGSAACDEARWRRASATRRAASPPRPSPLRARPT